MKLKNKIAGEALLKINIGGEEFSRIKYYTPIGNLENKLLDNEAFKTLILKNKGVYVSMPDENTKVFAIKFTFGKDEFPFMDAVDNVTFKDGFIIVGVDKECNEFFMPVF